MTSQDLERRMGADATRTPAHARGDAEPPARSAASPSSGQRAGRDSGHLTVADVEALGTVGDVEAVGTVGDAEAGRFDSQGGPHA